MVIQMTETVIFLHVAGAITTGIIGSIAVVILLGMFLSKTNLVLKFLNLLSIFQIGTGAILSLLLNETYLSFCQRSGMYLGIILLIEWSLLMKQKGTFTNIVLTKPQLFNVGLIAITSLALSQ
ncbi:hypothetical protein KC573_00475 [candidate division WWE3 bacterium]|uniref:Uncharacterized protein n=1 Tax=candidate division WWE3 bacterium TaxID=2053526 RepID=A0A955LVG8_UNCKA|nr:hypothetical protein [candidate division WWE3 bacterium]